MLISPTVNNIYSRFQSVSNNRFVSNYYGNLAPLKQDTVSFTGGKKVLDYSDENGEAAKYGINKTTAIKITKEAIPSQRYLDQKLNQILGDLVRPEKGKGSLSKPIKSITSRIKTPDSLVEKSQTRRLDSEKEVKESITDIVGARIVMADNSKAAVDKVIQQFTKAVQNNQIKVLEIENYRPDPEVDYDDNIIKSYDYSSTRALKELKFACDDVLGTSIRKTDEDTQSGYMAIHLLVQLPNGFTGEIQIIGSEVEKLKDIEDMCFKYKNNKTVKDIPQKVKNMLVPLKNKDDEILRKEHNIYTRNAYLYQREKEMNSNITDTEFLHIPDYLPESLDFNKIAERLSEQ